MLCGSKNFAQLPLWYPHYDNNPSFSDFQSFGGWTTPLLCVVHAHSTAHTSTHARVHAYLQHMAHSMQTTLVYLLHH